IYYQAGTVWVSTALQPDEVKYDAHLPAFAAIVSLASSIIGAVPSNVKMEAFSFETELVAPVYWTATKCRHPLLRRAALQLLTRDQMRDRRENLWHARETTVIAARVIEKEEAELADAFSEASSPEDWGDSSLSSLSSGGSPPSSAKRQTSPALKICVTQPPSLPPPPPS
ncbi:hypothetical protein PC129_g25528, partial [Phytophthora cactorum]